jgi:uncharacterized protein
MSSGHLDRRSFLRRATAVTAGAVVYSPHGGTANAATTDPASPALVADAIPTPTNWTVLPFANNQVALGPGLFADKRARILNFLRNYSLDILLYNFRVNAGLPTQGATRGPGAWEDPAGNLRGHYTGHALSALALAFAGTGDPIYRTRLDALVTGLAECRDALAATAARPTPRVAGKFGSALRLTGCQPGNIGDCEHVSLPSGIVRGLTDITVAAWVNLAERTNSTRIFDFGTSDSSHMYLSVAESTGGPRFAITTSGAAGEQRINASAPLPLNAWTHIAVTLSGNTGTLYVNGVPAGTNTAMTLRPADLGSTSANWIGRAQFPQRAVQFLHGDVDEFQLYGRALSAAEVRSLSTSTAGGGLSGLEARYAFDEPAGRTVTDSSGRGRHASAIGPNDGQRHPGFLAAYHESQFIRLEEFCTYSDTGIWAPWYTCHMIMRGLLDAYLYTGNTRAFDLVQGMADWTYSRLGQLPRAQLDTMWGIYIGGEYNAMNNLLVDLYALTGDQKHMVAAKAFDNTAFLSATANNLDTVDAHHANQHIPQFIGYLNVFDRTGEPEYYAAAANFWDMVVPHRIFTDGGMAGRGEYFGARDIIAGNIHFGNGSNAETCPCYNMLKLSRQLFFHTADPKYMQYYERALYGQILASRQDADSTTNPLLTYFVEMYPGARRGFGNLGTCCGGTGLESHAKFQDSVYFRSADGSTLYVNLYLASTLTWAERGFTITQTTTYPTDPAGTARLTVRGTGRLAVKLRVPYWASKGYTVRVNGVSQQVGATPGGYVTLDRTWAQGDTVDIAAPFTMRAERARDIPAKQSIAYGPVPMVIQNDSTAYLNLGFYPSLRLDGDLSRAATPTATPMTFSTNGFTLRPFYLGDTNRYHGYFTRVEPRIVFGAVDAGVPNRPRGDGLTFLDVVWDQAPFAAQADFVRAVDTVSAQWLALGLLTRTEQQRVRSAAARSDLRG